MCLDMVCNLGCLGGFLEYLLRLVGKGHRWHGTSPMMPSPCASSAIRLSLGFGSDAAFIKVVYGWAGMVVDTPRRWWDGGWALLSLSVISLTTLDWFLSGWRWFSLLARYIL